MNSCAVMFSEGHYLMHGMRGVAQDNTTGGSTKSKIDAVSAARQRRQPRSMHTRHAAGIQEFMIVSGSIVHVSRLHERIRWTTDMQEPAWCCQMRDQGALSYSPGGMPTNNVLESK